MPQALRIVLCCLLFLCVGTPAGLAQPARPGGGWTLQLYGFGAVYDEAIDFDAGGGAGVSVGRHLLGNWFDLEAGFEFTPATQSLRLVTGVEKATVYITQPFMAARLTWRPLSPATFFLRLKAAVPRLDPRPFTVDAGTAGTFRMEPPGEMKFSPGVGLGLTYGVSTNLALFFQTERSLVNVTERRFENFESNRTWKGYMHYMAGLLFSL